MNVTIIIVNYQTGILLKNCLQSIETHCSDIDYEVIVVDNNSHDDSFSQAQAACPQFTYISNPANIGFAAANNLAVKSASGKYLFFLNPDTVLLNNVPKILYDYMETHPEVGVCGGDILDEKLQPFYSGGDFPTVREVFFNDFKLGLFFPRRWFPSSGKMIDSINDHYVINVDYVVGADLFTRRDLFRELGGFDSRYFAYFEETDYCYRVKKTHDIKLLSTAKTIHYQGKSFGENPNRLKIYTESELKFFKKISPIRAFGVYSLHYFSNAFITFVYSLLKPEKAFKHRQRFQCLRMIKLSQI